MQLCSRAARRPLLLLLAMAVACSLHCTGTSVRALHAPALCRALEDGYLAILELRAAEAQQLAGRCLSEERYRQRLAEKGQGQEAAQQARPPQQQQQQQAAVQATPAPEAS